MKWKKRTREGVGFLGQGYESGEYKVEETYDSYNLQQKHGGRRKDYYWKLSRNNEIIKYGSTAKELKAYAEERMEEYDNQRNI